MQRISALPAASAVAVAIVLAVASMGALSALEGAGDARVSVDTSPVASQPEDPAAAGAERPAMAYGGYQRGVAVAGGSFNDGLLADERTPMTQATPGLYGHDWFYDVDGVARDDAGGLGFLVDRGVSLIRVDFRWERLQPVLGQALESAEVARITAMLDAAAAHGLRVVLDCHNYGHYKTAGSPRVESAQGGWAIGSDHVPIDAYEDLWRRIVATWGEHPAVWGWELMNEPVNMGSDGVRRWQRASQATVDAVRAAEADGRHRAVLVAGYNWSTVRGWDEINGVPWIDDPLNDPDRLLYTAHHYWDSDHDSSYGVESPRSLSGDTDEAYAAVVVDELRQFTTWLRRHGVRGAVTEVGWPDNDGAQAWNVVAERWYRQADAARLHVTAWATGAAWADYELAPYEVASGSWHGGDLLGAANTQAAVIERHLSSARPAKDPRTRAHAP